ncbi:metallophosphatase family protein [Vibrio sp. ZSDE26]|uniref:Phosphoesterase n=1 Tax=Vibrio amylolyticus TaxID=2847292 RepID=A0A9X2BGT5_9VIBR|nr:metallophosphoesterase family protein [Vibrio amylolyticus]MCK6263254.1 metallophosphatase family protein [Vibrio amylolyticus]
MKIAILSDIHGNLPALDVVLSDIAKSKCEHIFILGDLVGYYHWPQEVVQEVMALSNCTVIKGNHEDLLLRALHDQKFAIQCFEKYGSGLNVCIESLSPDQIKWIHDLPVSKKVTLDGIKFALFHGSEKEVNEYIYPDTSKERIDDIETDIEDYIFYGHTHYPVVFNRERCVIANPGSVGQPRDVGSLASYLILNTKNRALIQRRLPFDSDIVSKKSLENDPEYSYLVEILKRNNPYV